MKVLFVANLELHETEGIYKKVCAQAEAIEAALGVCDLITREGKFAKIKKTNSASAEKSDRFFLDYIIDEVNSGSVDTLYIRHMIPSPKLIKLLKDARNRKIKIFYEIPTYPYFIEQLRTSRRKHRAVVKIALDILFWPWVYYYIDKLVIIRSNSKTRHFAKMAEITNGVRIDSIRDKDYSEPQQNDVFRMVTVGTLYPYHGYDRVLKGLAQCGEIVAGVPVEFHVVGSSQTIDELHAEADRMGLKSVFFHGKKTTEELNEMYELFHVGLGCLALHRRNADIDTTLKIIEYYCRGVPVVTSGKTPMKDERFTYKVVDDESAIDIVDIYHFYNSLSGDVLAEISKIAKEQFDWKTILRNLMKQS